MQSFDDFLGSIDEEEMGNRIEMMCPPEVIQWDADSMPTFIQHIHMKCITESVNVSLLYLRKYHEWLEGQLSDLP